MQTKFLFLYDEMMNYSSEVFLKIGKLVDTTVVAKVKGVHSQKINFSYIKRESTNFFELLKLIFNKKPKYLFVSGFMDFGYVFCAIIYKFIHPKVKIICISDKQGKSINFLKKITYRFIFSKYIAVGPRQFDFAVNVLGYKTQNVYEGFYSAQDIFFNPVKVKNRPVKFLFIGRTIKIKGFDVLLKSIKLINSHENVVKLDVVGPPGELCDNVNYLGYLDASEIIKLVHENNYVGVLPSFFEPYGLVLHEYVAMGLPVITSKFCGAADVFIEDGLNGIILDEVNEKTICTALNYYLTINEEIFKKHIELSILKSKKIMSDDIADMFTLNFK